MARKSRKPDKYDGGALGSQRSKQSIFQFRYSFLQGGLSALLFAVAIAVGTLGYIGYDRFSKISAELAVLRTTAAAISNAQDSGNWIKLGDLSAKRPELLLKNVYKTDRQKVLDAGVSAEMLEDGSQIKFVNTQKVRISTRLNVRAGPYRKPENRTKFISTIPFRTSVEISEIKVVDSWVWAKIEFQDD